MKVLSRFFAVFVSAVFFVLFASCANEKANASVSVSELSVAISSAVPLDEGYYSASDSYCKYYFKDENGTTLFGNSFAADTWTVQKSKSQSSENEFGIFITDQKNIYTVKSACEKYIETRKNAYMESKAAYSPEEYEKFRDAEVLASKNCVIYFIMNKADVNIAKEAVSSLLK